MKMLHATSFLIVGLAAATVNAQIINDPIFTGVSDASDCLVVKDANYKNGSPIILLVYWLQQF